MGKIKYSIVGLLIPLLGACFSDDGNYNYESLKPPTWLRDVVARPIQIVVREGGKVRVDGSKYFNWGTMDSLQRSQEVRYEWRYNGKLFCEELKAEIPYEEFMRKVGEEEIPTHYQSGDFSIIEKSSGVSFKGKITFFFYPRIGEADFIVYSEKSTSTPNIGTLSVLQLGYKRDNNGRFTIPDFALRPHESADIPGTPKQLDVAVALNVSAIGSVTAITEEGDASVFNASNLKKVWDMSELFADGTPPNFKVSSRKDQEVGGSESPAFTWVATQDGRVFTRKFSKNYLGGKFITEPYYLDEKGYKITKFGHTCWGITNIPCYDEKNRRVVVATSLEGEWGSYRSFMTTLHQDGWTGVPVMEMPVDTKVYFITCMDGAQYWDRNNSWFQVYYNTGGKSMVGTFTIDNRGRRLNTPNAYFIPYEVTGHLFNDDTRFLVAAGERLAYSSSKAYTDLFSEGTEVYAIKRQTWPGMVDVSISKLPLTGITSKITFMTYDRDDYYLSTSNYQHLIIGCENGDILIYNAEELAVPQFLKKYNVGGKVVAVKQLGLVRATVDMY